MNSYNTKQKHDVLSLFASCPDRGFTIEEATVHLPSVPRSTVYRIITKLSAQGLLRHTGNEGRKAVYQYQGTGCASHMHVRCRVCGKTAHLDAGSTKQIEAIISSSLPFIALETTVIEGLCNDCREKNG